MSNENQKKEQRVNKYMQHKFGSKYQQKQEIKKDKPQVKTREKCSCGYLIKGPNHEQGTHHKQGRKA